MTDTRLARFRRWFWRPPRSNGAERHGRTVSGLELFYDLVYVAVIIQLAHHLAAHLTLRGAAEFGVIFALVFIAWVNGSLYLELHGDDDGRTRTFVFVEMGALALLAVYIADAASGTGDVFTLAYAFLLAVMTWLWHSARGRNGDGNHGGADAVLGRYVRFMTLSVIVLAVAALLPDELRAVTWAGFALAWVVVIWLAGRSPAGLLPGLAPTAALIERFGLLVIIVLGEVFFGVVNGLVDADRDLDTVGTGLLTLLLGFVIWWIYADLVGRRHPRADGPAMSAWLLLHLPLTLSIAAIGAGAAGLIAAAHDPGTPQPTAWLVGGSVAVVLVALVLIETRLDEAARLPSVYRPVGVATLVAAAIALLVGWLQPAPWVLVGILVVVLSALWLFTVGRFMTETDVPGAGPE